jgi:membrane-associated PAP2 superfamily phosphatase
VPDRVRLRVTPYRSWWLPELVALAASAVAAAVLFLVTRLDIETVRPFYRPELAEPWAVASRLGWRILYHSTPFITGSLVACGGVLLIAGLAQGRGSRARLHGLFVLLCVVVGPGLIVNAILKDHWGRPRPREIRELGGGAAYIQPLVPSGSHGASFPCGHCSVGFLYGVGWWVWRRSRPRRAAASLGVGLSLGMLLGVGRMAAGGHFLSDAVWAGWISFATAHVLYYYVLRIPAREDALAPAAPAATRLRLGGKAIAAICVFAAAGLAGGVLWSWRYVDLTARLPLSAFPEAPEQVEIVADELDVELHLIDPGARQVECSGDVHGFGFPGSRIEAGWSFLARPVPTLRYRVAEKGWYVYVDATARIRLPWRGVRRVSVSTRSGNITVLDETEGRFGEEPRPTFDLHTAHGRTFVPPTLETTSGR